VKAVREIEEGERVEPGTLLERVEKEVLKLSEEGGTATETLIAEAVAGVMARLEDYHRGNVQLQGLTTGIEFVDKMLCGIGGDDNGNYYVLSGRPGTGKTAWALQIADHVATEHVWWEPILVDGPNGKKTPLVELADGPMGQVERFKCERRVGRPVVVFSLEMSLHGLTARLLFRRARVNAQNMRTGFGTKEEFERLRDAWELFAKGNRIVIEDKGCYEFESLKAKARRMARQYGAKLIVVDYLQLTESSDRKLRENRVLELAWISKSIQRLGKELRIPLLVLAQMNRDYEKEVTRPPRLSDLKDCGQVEQDADVVGFLYQPRMKQKTLDIYREAMGKIYGEKNEADWPMRVDLLIAKARNGKTGACRLLFERNFTNFLDWHAWLKGHGLAAPAKGEEPQYRDRELPTNEEMDL
jgi:replicative DNA helicase